MNADNKIVEFMLDVSKKLGNIDASLSSFCQSINNHEGRIQKLEDQKTSLKDDFIKLLVKTLTISIVGLIILGGGGVALVKILPFIGI